ncbi:MAG: tRNA preQ1(34) S-adenosylmethionine ribosyltransferase-isomerase QueA [Planctomycetaceae bacterium]|jgi:S-adenosylmethionine:tRNA ribosyltransferase-isomerase|nr:tRNA preQ1(34) S-adenosylmethionine ribosyltransferase-isomerase QueA [Planctomycetaceae bacterium]
MYDSLSHYDYELPPELIAQQPAENRSDARLLVVYRRSGLLEHRYIRDLPEYLQANDCLAVNNSKVIPARLLGKRNKTGGRWEGLVLRFISGGLWEILAHTRGNIQNGETVTVYSPDGSTAAIFEVIVNDTDRTAQGTCLIRLCGKGTDSAVDLLEHIGHVPLPPYIRKGRMNAADKERYQTVYAEHYGSAAAPTAGLHFTPELLDRIKEPGTNIVSVTLHVGIGTFKPITVENINEHQIHSETAEMTEETATALQRCRKSGGRILAVGTTSVRVLETAFQKPFAGEVSLFIRPPYEFRSTDMLLTNFHFPKSTLLILVRTFGGDELISEAYRTAVKEKYRFFSYGDAMLII